MSELHELFRRPSQVAGLGKARPLPGVDGFPSDLASGTVGLFTTKCLNCTNDGSSRFMMFETLPLNAGGQAKQ